MYCTEIIADTFPEQRLAIREELLARYKEICYRAYCEVTPLYWGSFPLVRIIDGAIERLAECIPSGVYEALFSWAREVVRYGNTGIVGKVISFLTNVVLEIGSAVVPVPCALHGELRLRFGQLEALVAQASERDGGKRSLPRHNPVDAAVDEITNAINNKDYATGEHSRVVSSWCHRLGVKLGLSQEEVERVTRGGLIHDLGKTTTPIEILAAPRRLTDEEWKIMANHVVAGHDMLLQMPILHDFQSIVRHHHERLDGKGYPDQLSGDEIPFLTRIVTVADCYNAMVGRRSYRRAMSPEVALEELRRHKGSQFDPDVADAMIELANEDNRACRPGQANLSVRKG